VLTDITDEHSKGLKPSISATPTITWRSAATGAVGAIIAHCIARISSKAALTFVSWWTRQHILHPRWIGSAPVTRLAFTQFGVFKCDLRDYVQSQLFLTGQWEPTVGNTITKLLRPGDVFIDVGANIGYLSLVGAKAVDANGLVLAFEPLLENVALLIENIKTNHVQNVVVISIACDTVVGVTKIYHGPFWSVGQSSIRPVSESSTIVWSAPLDTLIAGDISGRVRLVKIDVEGAEWNVLRGMTAILRQPSPPCVICEITEGFLRESNQSAKGLIDFMRDLNYCLYIAPCQGAEEWTECKEIPQYQFDALFVPRGFQLPRF